MDSSIIHSTYKEKLYCCCFLMESIMACCTNNSLIIWDFAALKPISDFSLQPLSSPISVHLLKHHQNTAQILIQSKEGLISIITYNSSTNIFIKEAQYNLQMMGFTRLSIDKFIYNEKGIVKKHIGSHFYTIKYKNFIEKRQILTGKVLQTFAIEDMQFQQISFLMTVDIDEKIWYYIAEEGATIKKIGIPIGHQEEQLEIQKILPFKSKQDIKIILWIEVTHQYQAYVCLRNDKISIFNLITLDSIININYSAFRIIKRIQCFNKESEKEGINYLAMASKNGLTLMNNTNQVMVQCKMQHGMILDMDICQFGMIAVSEQGKILFLPVQL